MKLSEILRSQAELIEKLENQGEKDFNINRIALSLLEVIVFYLRVKTH